jgi:hypothetical protein
MVSPSSSARTALLNSAPDRCPLRLPQFCGKGASAMDASSATAAAASRARSQRCVASVSNYLSTAARSKRATARRWPDRFGSHAAIEVAFTARGSAYFADRGAARDLALFIRTGLTQTIRREGGAAFAKAVRARYGRTIIRLASATAPIPANRIGYTPTPTGATLVERSSTGKRFSVELSYGHIKKQDLLPYTFLVLFQRRR